MAAPQSVCFICRRTESFIEIGEKELSERVIAQEMLVTIHASENRSKLDSTDSAIHAVKDFVIREL
jgi:hypothetical protein